MDGWLAVYPAGGRAGGFSGTGLQDTWVLHSSHALSEANEVEDPDHYTTAALVSRSSDEQVHPFWSTTYRWNLTHPPPLAGHVWGAGGGSSGGWGLSGAGQAGTSATTATTLFLAVYAECVFTSDHDGSGDGGEGRRGCPRRAEEAGGGGGGGGGGDEEGGAADGLWALGVAPRVEFRCVHCSGLRDGGGYSRGMRFTVVKFMIANRTLRENLLRSLPLGRVRASPLFCFFVLPLSKLLNPKHMTVMVVTVQITRSRVVINVVVLSFFLFLSQRAGPSLCYNQPARCIFPGK